MKIEVGEYVRTIDGFIGVFDRYSKRPDTSIYKSPFNCFIKLQNRKTPLQCHRDYIVKHSKIISEIVEVGDYVNGYKVISIDYDVIDNKTECIELDLNNNYQYNFISARQIKSIVTHEQMASIEYKVEEEK